MGKLSCLIFRQFWPEAPPPDSWATQVLREKKCGWVSCFGFVWEIGLFPDCLMSMPLKRFQSSLIQPSKCTWANERGKCRAVLGVQASFLKLKSNFTPFKLLAAVSAMAVGMLLSISVCVVAVLGEESCDTPTRSAALLQSSVHRNCKSTAEPYVISPAAMFGPMRPGMGPHQVRPPMGPPGMQNYPGQPSNLEHLQGRGESSYGTSGEVTPCQNSSAWTPEYDFAGYCNTWSLAVPLTKEACDHEGCRYSHSYCYCETEAGCTAVGATWSLGRIKVCYVLENLFVLQVNITARGLCTFFFRTQASRWQHLSWFTIFHKAVWLPRSAWRSWS